MALLALFGVVQSTDINPALRPESDNKFMHDDYPSDERPGGVPHPQVSPFNHPYPAVQDSEDYDKDYTKDENDDNGEWRAQTEYDMLKIKVAKQMQVVREARAKEQKEHVEYDSAVVSQEEAEKLAKAAEKKALDAANVEPDDPSEKKWGIRPAIDKVEAETIDLEKCREELEAARKRLADLQARLAEAEKAHAAAVADHKDKRATEIKREQTESNREKSLAEEEREYQLAKKDYEEQKKELEAAEEKLETYEKKVRQFRSKVDDKGGVYREQPPKKMPSSAHAGATFSALALVAVMFAN